VVITPDGPHDNRICGHVGTAATLSRVRHPPAARRNLCQDLEQARRCRAAALLCGYGCRSAADDGAQMASIYRQNTATG
jgi:hypothetical protein